MHTFSTHPGAESKCYNCWQNHGDLIPSHYRRRYWGKWTTHWRVPHTQTHSDEIIGGLNSLRGVQILWKSSLMVSGELSFSSPRLHMHTVDVGKQQWDKAELKQQRHKAILFITREVGYVHQLPNYYLQALQPTTASPISRWAIVSQQIGNIRCKSKW